MFAFTVRSSGQMRGPPLQLTGHVIEKTIRRGILANLHTPISGHVLEKINPRKSAINLRKSAYPSSTLLPPNNISHIEPEVHYVAVLDDVILALYAQLAGIAHGRL